MVMKIYATYHKQHIFIVSLATWKLFVEDL